MSQCQRCGGNSPDAFLCRTCESDLRDMLLGLPKWMSYLHDAAVGATRLGESARRSGDLTSPMPVNLSASALYEQVHGVLTRWVQDVCESRGVEVPNGL